MVFVLMNIVYHKNDRVNHSADRNQSQREDELDAVLRELEIDRLRIEDRTDEISLRRRVTFRRKHLILDRRLYNNSPTRHYSRVTQI